MKAAFLEVLDQLPVSLVGWRVPLPEQLLAVFIEASCEVCNFQDLSEPCKLLLLSQS